MNAQWAAAESAMYRSWLKLAINALNARYL